MISNESIRRFGGEQQPATGTGSKGETNTVPERTGERQHWDGSPEGVAKYLNAHGVVVAREKKRNGYTVLVLDKCPFNESHGHRTDTAVVVRGHGVIGFACKHDSCQGYQWKDLRKKIDPNYTPSVYGDVSRLLAEPDGPKPSQANALVEIVRDVHLFHWDDLAYGTTAGRTLRIVSKEFARWLKQRYYEKTGKAASATALQDAIGTIEAMAICDGPLEPVYIRLGERDGSIYLDLGDEQGRCVEITPNGWTILNEIPVRFLRPRHLRPLPLPVHGGDIQSLRGIINVPSDKEWRLLVSWMVACFMPYGPYPCLFVTGPQGSAKSTACELIRNIVDPNSSPLRAEPKDVQSLMVAATHSWIVGFDNLSRIQGWLSDALCRLSTGGGCSTRELYTDGEEFVMTAMRPVILNGITNIVSRPDLAERTVIVTLPAIEKGQRRSMRDLKAAYAGIAGGVLGALCDAVAVGLKRLPSIPADSLPRMADYAVWASACETAFGFAAGTFLQDYADNEADMVDNAFESSPLAQALIDFLVRAGTWEGTHSELLAELTKRVEERTVKNNDWPHSGNKLVNDLKRLEPVLGTRGISIQHLPRTKGGRPIRLTLCDGGGGNIQPGDAPSGDAASTSSPRASPQKHAPGCTNDAGDAGDAPALTLRCEDEDKENTTDVHPSNNGSTGNSVTRVTPSSSDENLRSCRSHGPFLSTSADDAAGDDGASASHGSVTELTGADPTTPQGADSLRLGDSQLNDDEDDPGEWWTRMKMPDNYYRRLPHIEFCTWEDADDSPNGDGPAAASLGAAESSERQVNHA